MYFFLLNLIIIIIICQTHGFNSTHVGLGWVELMWWVGLGWVGLNFFWPTMVGWVKNSPHPDPYIPLLVGLSLGLLKLAIVIPHVDITLVCFILLSWIGGKKKEKKGKKTRLYVWPKFVNSSFSYILWVLVIQLIKSLIEE